jgi:RNA polymerase sigma-70 factor, ECF subfamily
VSGDKIPEDHVAELADCFAAHASGVFGYACVLACGNRALAEDLVQSAFVAAAGQWPVVRCLCDAQRVSWLYTTVGHLAVSVFRHHDAFRGRLQRLEALYRPPSPGTHAEAVSGIALQRCWQAIQALPPQQHAVAVMRWLLAMSNRDIAAALNIAEGTVAAHLSAVRVKLRAGLGPYDPSAARKEDRHDHDGG